jgi:hypothetical protein
VKAHHYEIRLMGQPSEQALARLAVGVEVADQRSESVLITGRIGQGDLRDLLVRISDLGLDIREIRRLPEGTSIGTQEKRIGDGISVPDG